MVQIFCYSRVGDRPRVAKVCLLGSRGHGCQCSDSGLTNNLEPLLRTPCISV